MIGLGAVIGWIAMRASFARSGFILGTLLLYSTQFGSARDVPDDLSFQILIKPAGNKLGVLVRAPFQAFGDIRFPLHGDLGNLDLTQIDTALPGVARWWIADSIDLYENGAQIPKPEVIETRVAVQSDSSFSSYESALAHVTGERLASNTQIFPNQAWLDVLFEYPIRSGASDFSIRTRFARFGARVTTALRFISATGATRSYTYEGDPKTFTLDPLAGEVVSRFFRLGFSTILRSVALLLCLVCVVLPFHRLSMTIPLVAAFLAAFTIALVSRDLAPGHLWFPTLVETLTSASIVYLGFENILGLAAPRRRYMLALAFGLLFGFSLSFSFEQDLQFGGAHTLISVLGFGAGAVLAQVALCAILLPAVNLLLVFSKERRVEIIIISALAAHVSWHWMAESADRLSRFPIAWPAVDLTLLVSAMQWVALIAILAGIYWLGSSAFPKRENRDRSNQAD